jgi:small-conductance mechanosensitive channel
MLLSFFSPDFLAQEFFDNMIYDYVIAAGVFVWIFVLFLVIDRVLLLRFRKFALSTKHTLDDLFVQMIDTVHAPFYFFVALYFAARSLFLPPEIDHIFSAGILIITTVQVILILQKLIDYTVEKRSEHEEDGPQAVMEGTATVLKIFLWVVASLLVLSNLGLNITSLIAGLGVSGIIVAFALQNVLQDLFSSFSIYLDKPFKIGDFVIIGDLMGTVEKIGIKTSRIRSLSGEQIVVPNTELTSDRIKNYAKLERRRIELKFGVDRNVTNKQIRAIVENTRKIIENIDKATVSRVHFVGVGSSAVLFEVIYFVEDPSYDLHMDIRQEIWLQLREYLQENKIGFAYETQRIMLEK